MPDRRLRERDPPTLPPSPRGPALHGRQALKERQQSPWRLERRVSRTWSYRNPRSDVFLELPRLSGKSRQVHRIGNCLSNSAGLICPNVECLRCGLQSPSMCSAILARLAPECRRARMPCHGTPRAPNWCLSEASGRTGEFRRAFLFTDSLASYTEVSARAGHPARCLQNICIGHEVLVDLSIARRRGGPWALGAVGAFLWRGHGYRLEGRRFVPNEVRREGADRKSLSMRSGADLALRVGVAREAALPINAVKPDRMKP